MGKVYRCFVEKKPGYDVEAGHLLAELKGTLGLKGLTGVRVLRRYDVEGVDQGTYEAARTTVLSEPQVDAITDEVFELPQGYQALAVEALPGQYDQRADSCAQCIQMLTGGERPTVRAATLYLLAGELSKADLDKARGYLINPVESREADLNKPDTLMQQYPEPADVPVLDGFRVLDQAGLEELLNQYGLAMDLADLTFLQRYFRDEEKRDPTLTEVRVVDTYWSDHCRHTTFSTHLDRVDIQDPTINGAYLRYLSARDEVYGREKAAQRPQTLMDLATIGTKVLKKRGELPELDESEEINACSIHVPATVDGKEQDWLLMFKNETHNHPTEIEPFGGAATCIGGCIRDPLSGRVYVHQAMRLTGCGDPRTPVDQTLAGKLPQRKIAQTAAAGYSSYGNQIGLATGHVAELYHEGYIAKHLECGAVVGAAPADHVRREVPAPGDVVVLLGGRTGRDGIGGATGSSKSHNLSSLDTMASEVQKGNAPEERKLQRLFRNPNVTRLIKRCNDFGAGGVSVAIGELADGLAIDLDAVRKKYDGLDGTEIAISESQERMAVVVAPQDVDTLLHMAATENLEAYPVATVTESPRMVMTWRGKTVANLSRAFLNTNGAVKHAQVKVAQRPGPQTFEERPLRELAKELDYASRRGLIERFDGSIGAASVLMPFGGKTQRTPAQAMAALFPVEPGQETDQASIMAWGCDPKQLSRDPYYGAVQAVVTSVAKVVAAGGDYKKVYLTLQEFFEKLREEPTRWGKPFQALLGAMDAQLGLGCAAIGGKDSMSGSFLDLDVPPTLISFAIAPAKAGEVLSPEFKGAGNPVYLFGVPHLGDFEGQKKAWEQFHALCLAGKVKAARVLEPGGVKEAAMQMAFGNHIGFTQEEGFAGPACQGMILAECDGPVEGAVLAGRTTAEPVLTFGADAATIDELLTLNEGVLEDVYPTRTAETGAVEAISWDTRSPAVCKSKIARPRVVIPVFPGTNCEYDSVRACLRAGMDAETVNIRNLTADDLLQSTVELEGAIRKAQIVFIPGGFSGGDEPDGSAKFICSFFRNSRITDAVHDLLKNRDGLMLGICNGFQALIKLGLVPYGEIRDMDENCPTLTYNTIGRHQSRYVTTRVASVNSPWMLKSNVGDLHAIPISHGEGRFVAPQAVVEDLIAHGQVATQYVDGSGVPSMDMEVNPNGSLLAIEGIFSPDGRVFGKMGHSERRGDHVARNIPGEKYQPLFDSGAEYFK
ncbi:phosphoribosylformylglycinamidine synthase [Pseudoflavonifractor phocaeensis]|uniref:phosphoribosylformylglycinamidine synthase n=1 Tax=Pseudoflavonifractor phocaeensis TaxID=1870988 RepID=UPI00195DBC87|nr:phosphoribosylformylglycinamidine synthase [Pseudoflavonifractor phocaeensis]MBM6887649.1 phosphoribosylformylglycinamidine synthase [Pseudoflavonifractor phocaeensis]